MAKNKCTVLLGYEDDLITEKQKHFIDFTTNKVGGKPVRPHFYHCKIFFLFDFFSLPLLCIYIVYVSCMLYNYRIGLILKYMYHRVLCALVVVD